ncbi:MAG: acyl--CoA ligase, partial [Proteobacteria bacterium]|nr:acyl--CoA ligase [Pseudomonadota bacterium]
MRESAAPAWPAMSLAQAHALLTQPGSPFEMEEIAIRGRPTRVWRFGPPTLRETFLAGRAYGPRTFFVYEDERATYDAFARAALTLAQALMADGVKAGDRVALVMRNLPEWPVAFFAAALIGAVVTPLNAWWTGAELEYALRDCGAKAAVVDGERLERLLEHLPSCPNLERVYASRVEGAPADPRIGRLEDVIGRTEDWAALPEAPLPDVPLDPEQDATIFYTSGTTGKPKGAVGTHRNAGTSLMAGLFSLARSYLRRGEAPPGPDPRAPQKVALVSIPFFHTTGCNAVLIPAVVNGGRLVTMRKWDPERAMQLIEREGVTSAGGVPTIAWQLIEHPARARYDLSSLELVTYGGAPAAGELVRRIKSAFPHAAPGSGWGMTETSATHTHHLGEDYEHRPDSCGPALPVSELKVMGADGETLPPGEVGELWAAGPNIVKGYWRHPEATAETFVGGWVRTGDLARLDEEGFCYIVD